MTLRKAKSRKKFYPSSNDPDEILMLADSIRAAWEDVVEAERHLSKAQNRLRGKLCRKELTSLCEALARERTAIHQMIVDYYDRRSNILREPKAGQRKK